MDPERVRRNLELVREQIGPDVEVLAAVKYVEADDLPALAEAGIDLVGRTALGAAGQAGGPRRAVHLGLHRPAPEPQGEGRGAERAPDPLARLGLRSAKLEEYPRRRC